jgi:CheY-like chemotaxis protein
VQPPGGDITVESEGGRGTTFTIYLPQVVEAEASSPESDTEIPRGRGETILVVEDKPEVLDVARGLLEHLNYRVLTATNGQEGLAAYDSNRDEISLVLTDVVMPVMGGLEMVEALKEKDPDVRAVLMSGYPLGGGEAAHLLRGIAGNVGKPLNIEQMAQTMSKALSEP